MTKRGQVTAFIVLGIVLVLLGVVFFMAQSNQMQKGNAAQESVAVTANGIAVSQFIKGCIDTTAKSGVLLSGLQGGYTDVPPNYFPAVYSDVPYYYDRGQISLVKTADIESQIKRFMNANFKVCIGNFSTFTEKGVDVTGASPTINVTINSLTGMSVTMDYDVTVGKGANQESLRTFRTDYDYRIGTLREVAQKIVDRIAQEPKLIPLSYITELNREYDVQIDSITYGDDRIVYVIKDLKTNVQGDTPLIFLFATRMDMANNLPVITFDESKLAGKVGEEFNLTIDATDADYDPIEFDTDSDTVGIDPLLGEIRFTPEQAGKYIFNIIASDGKGNTTKPIVITII